MVNLRWLTTDKLKKAHEEDMKRAQEEQKKKESTDVADRSSNSSESTSAQTKPTVLLTGASRGVGRALAFALAREGYPLVLTCHEQEEKLADTLIQASQIFRSDLDSQEAPDTQESQTDKDLSSPIPCMTYGFMGDLSKPEVVEQLFAEIAQAVEQKSLPSFPEILINNAGIAYTGLTQFMEDADWERVIGTNLTAPFYLSRGIIPHLVHEKRGLIINISSIWGKEGSSCEVAYSASKAGLEGMTRALAKELEPSGVDVIAVRLGMIDTDMNAAYTDEDMREILPYLNEQRMGTAEETAAAIVDIMSTRCYATGEIIDLPFGWFVEDSEA